MAGESNTKSSNLYTKMVTDMISAEIDKLKKQIEFNNGKITQSNQEMTKFKREVREITEENRQ